MEAKFAGLALKVAEHALFKKAFIGFLAGFDVSFAELEHSIEQAGEFVGSGVDSRGRSKTDLNASDERSDGSFALHGALSGQAQGGRSAIGILSRFARKDFTSADAIVGSDIEPGAKVLT